MLNGKDKYLKTILTSYLEGKPSEISKENIKLDLKIMKLYMSLNI
jgi:hypothetical protein